MPLVKTTPKNLKPYQFHGVNLEWSENSEQGIGDCPLCGKEGKFYVSVATGQWDCKVCAAKGNVYTFLRAVYDTGKRITRPGDLEALASDRGLLYPETLDKWGVVKSPVTSLWMLPGHSPEGKLNQLYLYVRDPSSKKMRLYATPELPHCVYGVPLADAKKEAVYVCEGPWDAMALWELMGLVKYGPTGALVETGSVSASLLGTANVIAVPSCNTMMESWAPLFSGKKVTFLYDNDHPRKNPQTGLLQEPGAFAGMRRAAQVLAVTEEAPAEVRFLRWMAEKDHNPKLPSGYDVRDALTSAGNDVLSRAKALEELLARVGVIPQEWVAGRARGTASKGGVEIECAYCDRWKPLENSWRKAMKWTEGLDRALSVQLACILSTKAVGDQLWVKIIGPAACGKSTLCEALSVNRRYVRAKSTIRGFHSGFKSDAGGSEDNSLLAQLFDMTLVTKDGDTLLQSPNLSQILAEARDIYDRTSRTHYRNRMGKDYNGLNMTWILCGTSSLRQLDSSELGERFLDCVIMEGIDDELEDEVLLRKAHQAKRSLSIEANGSSVTQNDPELIKAMQLTGGYIDYLRVNAQSLLDAVRMPDWTMRRCITLGKFVAYMRARPSTRQEESAEREFATRLVSQMVRLANCLAVVLNVKEIDEEVMRRVTRVALDTARGRTLEIAKHLYKTGEDGIESSVLSVWTGESTEKLAALLRFLRRIGVVEHYNKASGVPGMKGKPRWRLTERIRKIYPEVMESSSL